MLTFPVQTALTNINFLSLVIIRLTHPAMRYPEFKIGPVLNFFYLFFLFSPQVYSKTNKLNQGWLLKRFIKRNRLKTPEVLPTIESEKPWITDGDATQYSTEKPNDRTCRQGDGMASYHTLHCKFRKQFATIWTVKLSVILYNDQGVIPPPFDSRTPAASSFSPP